MSPLADVTNAEASVFASAPVKTFSRRAKGGAKAQAPVVQPAAPDEESSPDSGGAPLEQQAEYCWLKSGLSRRRRTSVLIFPSLAEAGQSATARKQPRGRAPKDRPQRAAELRAIMEELAEQFQEVDAFELVEESPVRPKASRDQSAGRQQQWPPNTLLSELRSILEQGATVEEGVAGEDQVQEEEEREEQGEKGEDEAALEEIAAAVSPLPALSAAAATEWSEREEACALQPSLPLAVVREEQEEEEQQELQPAEGHPAAEPQVQPSVPMGSRPSPAPAPPLDPLQRLLCICGQKPDAACVPSLEELLTAEVGDLRRVAKVGEGSYGEAFKLGQTVFKIIPIEGSQHVNGYPQKKAADLTGEALVSLTLSGLRDDRDAGGKLRANVAPSFVHTSRVAISHGPYPRALARAWHKWDKEHGSENDAVDGPGFGPGCPASRQQLYLVLAMGDSGRDLERHQLSRGLEEACCILLQTALGLAVGERAVEFEHRDLHWGNLLLRPATSQALAFRLDGCDLLAQSGGVQVTMIDFTASRLVTSDGQVAVCDLSQDPEVFEGPKGEVQFDTYRFMRVLTGDEWSASVPATNCLWMAYLAETLAAQKIAGSSAAAKAARRKLRDFRKRCATQYTSCHELVLRDELFSGLLTRPGGGPP